MRFRSISTRIFLCYLLAICLSTLVAGVSFYSLVRRYIEREAGLALAREAGAFAQSLASGSRRGHWPLRGIPSPMIFIFGGRPIESHYVVTDRDGSVISASSPEDFPIGSRWDQVWPEGSMAGQPADRPVTRYGRDFVAGVAAIPGSPDSPGMVIVYTRRSVLQTLNMVFWKYLIQGFGIGALVAAGFTVYLTSRIVHPLSVLRDKVRELGRLNFDVGLDLGRNDEIGELAMAFDDMARRLSEHDQAMRRFLHNTSHELKTPLMSIRGYAEGIRDGVFEGDEVGLALDVITAECQRLQAQVDELLYLGRLESPSERYELEPLVLRKVAEGVLAALKGWLETEGLTVDLDIPPDLTVLADKDKLECLLRNLLSNAIRHATNRILVSAKDDAAEGFTEIEVKDDGPGFSPEDLPNVFMPFYRGRGGEAGLGLAIVKAIAEGHRGWAVAENAAGGGAIVRIGLPKNPGAVSTVNVQPGR
ncbi:MAG: HAMP domain-containing histidine kinase [Candidatus Fermentithermobacillus carboniphilus]|uniref:histidine kinase n=1 Tax=Candidatus Fermentithermobacillus carboniphilus TaxID=3085328 RepID=A0AAT9LA34_9FIRM|nr:MAG: HAMP domain-containing histidine kinase [Candidatus Fermentithermobacillus carboniphilus]